MIKLLVCGGRNYNNYEFLSAMLNRFDIDFTIDCLIQGGARGADYLSKKWAESKGIPVIEVKANWDKYNKAAGSLRNGWMIEYCNPTHCLAFPGGFGTQNMITLCKKYNIPNWQCKED